VALWRATFSADEPAGPVDADWSDPDLSVLITSNEQDPQTRKVLRPGERMRLPGGAYSVQAISKSGRAIQDMTFALPWLDGGMATIAGSPANISLGRGDRLNIRVSVATHSDVITIARCRSRLGAAL